MHTDDESDRPNLLVVLAAGVCCPGAGLVAAGRWRTGVACAALFVAAALVVPWVVIDAGLDLAKLPGFMRAASLALWAPSVLFGVIAARLDVAHGPHTSRRIPHPWWILGVAVLTWAARVAVNDRVVGEHIVAFVTPSEAQLRAVAPADADVRGIFVVAKRRFTLADVAPGAWVLIEGEAGQERALRVVAHGADVTLDDGRAVPFMTLRGAGVLAR